MEISTTAEENNIMVLEVTGEIDAYTSKTLNKKLKDLLTHGQNRLVIDLSKVTLISSIGLREILFAHREASSEGGEVRLLSPSPQIKRTLEISGLIDVLKISETSQEAMDGWE